MAAGNIINDVFDYKADLINKPKKVIVNKSISKANAITYYLILLVISLALSFLVDIKFLIIVLIANLLLLTYSLLLKRITLIGNITISALSASIPLLAIWIDVQHIFKLTNDSDIFYLYRFALVFSLLSFFGTLAREIIKDIEDLNGDKSLNSKSLPIIIGTNSSKYIGMFFIFILCGIILVYPPIIANDITFYYFIILVVVPLLVSAFKLRRSKQKNDFSQSSKLIKIAMLFTILFIALNGILSYDIF